MCTLWLLEYLVQCVELAGRDDGEEVASECVLVLVEETGDGVRHVASVVFDHKLVGLAGEVAWSEESEGRNNHQRNKSGAIIIK